MHLIDSIGSLSEDDMNIIHHFSTGKWRSKTFKRIKITKDLDKDLFGYLFKKHFVVNFFSIISKAKHKQWMLDTMLENDFNLEFSAKDFKDISLKLVTKDNVKKIFNYNESILCTDFFDIFEKAIDDDVFIEIAESVLQRLKNKEDVPFFSISSILNYGDRYKGFDLKGFQDFIWNSKDFNSDTYKAYVSQFNPDLLDKEDIFKIIERSNSSRKGYSEKMICSILKKDGIFNIFDAIESGLKCNSLNNSFINTIIGKIIDAVNDDNTCFGKYSESTILYALNTLTGVLNGGARNKEDKMTILSAIESIYASSDVPLEDVLIPFLLQRRFKVLNDESMNVVDISIDEITTEGINILKRHKKNGDVSFDFVLRGCLETMAKNPLDVGVAYRYSEDDFMISAEEFTSSLVNSYSLGFIDKKELNNLAKTYMNHNLEKNDIYDNGIINNRNFLSKFPLSLMDSSLIDNINRCLDKKIYNDNESNIEILVALVKNTSVSDVRGFDKRKDIVLEFFEKKAINKNIKSSTVDRSSPLKI